MDVQRWIKDRTIMMTLGGSHAYGLNGPTSDMDYRGVAIAPREYYFGLQNFEQLVLSDPDTQIYDLRKYVKLARDCNPNIIELMWCTHYDTNHWAWSLMLYNRELFLTRRAKFTFSGYAVSQLKRIKGHKQWIDNPPEEPSKNFTPPWMAVDDDEVEKARDEWKIAHSRWNQYQTWLKERNPARAELELKYGYDTKHAMHLIRLFRMGIEILTDGKVNTDRTDIDAQELLDIRNGKMSYNELIELAEYYESRIEAAHNFSPLPDKPDDKRINKLVTNIIGDYLATNP